MGGINLPLALRLQVSAQSVQSISTVRRTWRKGNIDSISQFKVTYTFFRISNFPSTLIEWKNLNKSIMNSESFPIFKEIILKFIQPNSIK